MKEFFVAIIFVYAVLMPDLFAQTDMLNLNKYVSYLDFPNGRVDYDSASNNRYLWAATDDDLLKFGVLADDEIPDNPLEVALLTYYSPEVVNMRPNEAAALLPANNPRLAGLKLGAALYQEMQVLRFLADTNAVTRCENMLRFVCERNSVTRAEVETFYRNGIRALVADIVNEEFNKIRFSVDTVGGGCNATLIRQGNRYTFVGEGFWDAQNYGKNGGVTKEFTGSSLDDLIQKMRASNFFNEQTRYERTLTINDIPAQAALIPAVVYANAQNNSLDLITEIITNFYLNPNATTYNAIRDVEVLYTDEAILPRGASPIFGIIEDAYDGVLISLNDRLARKVFDDYAALRNSPRRISLPDSTQRVLLDSRVIEATRGRL